MSEIRKSYKKKKHALRRAAKQLRSILEEVVKAIEDKTLVRAEVSGIRIKGVASLQRKAERNGWAPHQALSLCSDLVGGRVVCNNVEDTYRFAELLKERLGSPWDEFEVQDHISEPNGGYRALHINFRSELRLRPFQTELVPCEVQIRSRLQDAWAELSHSDIYKQPGLPDDLLARANDLAEVLAAADKIASSIRSRVSQATAAPMHCPDLGAITIESLAYSFKEIFGRSAPDYAIRQALDLCDKLEIVTLEKFPALPAAIELRNEIDAAYRSIIGFNAGPEGLFLSMIYSLAKGKSKAIKWMKRQARIEIEELDQIVRREALASIPNTVQEFIEELSSTASDAEIVEWATALEAKETCVVCGVSIVQAISLAEAAVQHYSVPSKDVDVISEQILSAIWSSGIEHSDEGESGLCMYCSSQSAKD